MTDLIPAVEFGLVKCSDGSYHILDYWEPSEVESLNVGVLRVLGPVHMRDNFVVGELVDKGESLEELLQRNFELML